MNDVKILGVCAYLANRFKLDVLGVRIAFIIGIVFTAGTALVIYLLIYLLIPKDQRRQW
ncbi:MAG: PspC domain-containing protein [Cryomorphaceae bacterium]|nr:PspC domain-containing protein [Cryomorphaceae bacterium]